MSIQTIFSGYIRRYDGDEVLSQNRFSSEKTVTEYGNSRIKLASTDRDISIMPINLEIARSIYIETDSKVRVNIYADKNASVDVYPSGYFFMNGSVSDVSLTAAFANASIEVKYDISG